MPPDLALGLMVLLLFIALGWMASSWVLAETEFQPVLGFRIGLAIVLGAAIAGYVGTLAVAAGRLDRAFIIAATLALGALVATPAIIWPPARRALAVPVRWGKPDAPTVACFAVASAIVACCFVHAALSPVTEWDAAIYHAGAAKLWFLEAPSPPLLYGPSVGIEISGNYPPLFPAIGALFDVAVGSFQDIYLRLLSPVLLAALLLLIYGYASRRIGSRGAMWAVILSVSAPLIVLYGTWATDYMLLTVLWLSVVVLCEMAAAAQGLRLWCAAGGVAGLAVLTHFYGLPALGVGLAAFLLMRPTRRNLLGALLVGCVAVAVAAPWLIRNTVWLHDPLYPLPLPLFHPIGLLEPLWGASQAEIRNNALGQWSGSGWGLIIQQAETVLFDRHLLTVGLLFGVAMGVWRSIRGDRRSLYILGATGLLVGTIVTPGWFWLRALLPVIPLVAILTGHGLVIVTGRDSSWRRRHAPFRLAMLTTSTAIFTVSAVVGGSLAVAGPNQNTWTTLLTGNQNDMMSAVRNLGSDPAALYNVYGGDYLSWNWLNDHLVPSQRVATLDGRLYYIQRPQQIFYLDGAEAGPLMQITDSSLARSFLAQQGVRFVMVPGWASSAGPAQHPAVHLLPLIGMLGDTDFPIAAVFVDYYPDPTVIYAVGPYSQPAQPGILPGIRSGLPPAAPGPYTLRAGDTSPRVVAPALNGLPTTLVFQYRLATGASLTINRWDATQKAWIYGVFSSVPGDAAGATWHEGDIALTATTGYTEFGLHASGGDVLVEDLVMRNPSDPVVIPGPGTSLGSGYYSISGQDNRNRLMIPHDNSATVNLLSFQYRGHGSGHFDLNYHDLSSDRWTTVASSVFTNLDGWSTVATPLLREWPFSEYAFFVDGLALDVRRISVASDPLIVSPVPQQTSGQFLFPVGTSSGRVLIPMKAGQAALVTLTFLDTPGTFGMNVLDRYLSSKWQFGPAHKRSGRESWRTVSVMLLPGPGRIVEIGPVAYVGVFVIRDVSITWGPAMSYLGPASADGCGPTDHSCEANSA